MQELNDAKMDQELRRHMSGIAQGLLDSLHIWCSAEQLITAAGLDWKGDNASTNWRALPDQLINLLDQLSQLTEDSENPTSMPWYAWRSQLDSQTNELSLRVGMLIDTL
jgi:hypothetical protein